MSERIEKIKAMLQNQPDDLFLNHALALEYIKAGDEPAARMRFEHNLATDKNYVGTYYHLGKLLERTGHPDEALQMYQQGMDIARALGDNHARSELQGAYEELADW
ncbi:hypothetical protein [Rurimicrobium arvi]|uniref:Tetratricopeptide repeat protein n=1 Tax=Rurimicrobium arvi TaxID=2049916 RepID=A0ABP8N422_9BACT